MKTISAWFEAQVEQTPDAIAVIFGDQSLTYQALNQGANYFAAQLFNLNVKPDMQIALCMERSIEQITAIIAILKAGCAYVPLDPSQPSERLHLILKEGSISILMTTSVEQTLFGDYEGRLIVLDDGVRLSEEREIREDIFLKPENLAYVIYTSGTTGVPKGVLIEHQSVVNYCQWFAHYSGARKAQRIDWSGNYIFDMVVSTSIVPLMLGGIIVICTDEIKKNPGAYLRYLKAHGVNLIKISPSYFRELVREVTEHPVELPDLHTIVLGGERLLTADCRAWLDRYPHQVLFNEYGPTEATVAVTQQKVCRDNIHLFPTHVPIGQPGSNMSCYILSSENEPVSPGETGELHIGGICLARGYLNHPELTRLKFISGLFKSGEEGRLYKTGDLCRQLDDGAIEFLGRMDQQVKIRGYRIESGEIEVCLRQHPVVQDAVVVVNNEGEYLLAYCILKQNTLKPSYTQMRKYLQQHLPEYMIPGAFIQIDHVPLTANGKLDYSSLPSPSVSDNQTYVAPRSALEKKLVAIWSKELSVKLIGINDNFFELGGHSLNAARIVAVINQTLKNNIEIKDFYQAETIAGVANLIKNAGNKPVEKTEVNLAASANKTMPLGDFQLFLWILKTFKPNVRKLNIVSRKRWLGQLDRVALNLAFRAILKRHDILSYRTKMWYPAQYQKAHRDFTMEETRLTDCSSEEAEPRLVTSLNQLLNFNAWSRQHPQIMVRLFYLQDGSMELQLCLPHLISDDHSIHILWNDLLKYYHAAIRNELPAKELEGEKAKSFKEYVFNEKQTMEMNFEQDDIFWKNYLHNTCWFSFPAEYTVQNMQSGYSTYQEISLPILENLEQYCAIHHIGLNAVLVAAVSLVLRNVSPDYQSRDKPIVMNIVKSTRNSQVWDETVGCFLRLDPVKVDISAQDTLLSLAKQIHCTIIENTKQMQASSILKLACIQSKNNRKTWVFLSKLFIKAYAKILLFFNLHYKSLQLIAQLSSFNPKNDYIICVNLRNNFTASVNKNENLHWDGQEEKNIQMYQHDLENFDSVCDISFLRDENDQKTPYVVISSNLQPDFRRRMAEEIIDVLSL